MVGGGNRFYLKFLVNRPRWSEIADFQPIFARSDTHVQGGSKKVSCWHSTTAYFFRATLYMTMTESIFVLFS